MAKKKNKTMFKEKIMKTNDGWVNTFGFEFDREMREEYRQLVNRVKRKAKNIRTKHRDVWIALGGLEIEKMERGEQYNANAINYVINPNLSTSLKGIENEEVFKKRLEKMKGFAKRGGELGELNQAKQRLANAVANRGANTDDLTEVIDYIKNATPKEFGQIFTADEIYNTLKDIYIFEGSIDYLEEFKEITGYNYYQLEKEINEKLKHTSSYEDTKKLLKEKRMRKQRWRKNYERETGRKLNL